MVPDEPFQPDRAVTVTRFEAATFRAGGAEGAADRRLAQIGFRSFPGAGPWPQGCGPVVAGAGGDALPGRCRARGAEVRMERPGGESL
jgi:hypothetical protein